MPSKSYSLDGQWAPYLKGISNRLVVLSQSADNLITVLIMVTEEDEKDISELGLVLSCLDQLQSVSAKPLPKETVEAVGKQLHKCLLSLTEISIMSENSRQARIDVLRMSFGLVGLFVCVFTLFVICLSMFFLFPITPAILIGAAIVAIPISLGLGWGSGLLGELQQGIKSLICNSGNTNRAAKGNNLKKACNRLNQTLADAAVATTADAEKGLTEDSLVSASPRPQLGADSTQPFQIKKTNNRASPLSLYFTAETPISRSDDEDSKLSAIPTPNLLVVGV